MPGHPDRSNRYTSRAMAERAAAHSVRLLASFMARMDAMAERKGGMPLAA